MKQLLPEGYEGKIDMGNVVHIESIYKWWQKAMILYANTYLNNIDDAFEVVDDVYLKLYQKGCQCESTAKAQGLLFRSIKNKCFDYLSLKKTKETGEKGYNKMHLDETDHIRTKEDTLAHSLQDYVWDIAFQKLSPLQYKVFRSRFMDGLTPLQAAGQLGVIYQTVKNQTNLALNRMKEECRSNKLLVDMYNQLKR